MYNVNCECLRHLVEITVMLNYILTYIIPFLNNFFYLFLLSTLLWFVVIRKVKPLEMNQRLKIVSGVVITILFVRYLLEFPMIVSLNWPPEFPETNFNLVKLNETVYLIIKLFLCAILFTSGILLTLWRKKAIYVSSSKLKPLIIFLFAHCIVEILLSLGTKSEALASFAMTASLANLIPLAICAKTVFKLSSKNKKFIKIFFFNYILSVITILGLGSVVLFLIAQYSTESYNTEETFIRNQIEHINIEDYKELSKFVEQVDGLTNYKVYLVQNPDVLKFEDKFFDKRTIPIHNQVESYIVFGSTYSDIHSYMGTLFRNWFSAILFFNLFFSLSYYLYKSRK